MIKRTCPCCQKKVLDPLKFVIFGDNHCPHCHKKIRVRDSFLSFVVFMGIGISLLHTPINTLWFMFAISWVFICIVSFIFGMFNGQLSAIILPLEEDIDCES